MAALWINSRSAPLICFSVSPHFIRAFPGRFNGKFNKCGFISKRTLGRPPYDKAPQTQPRPYYRGAQYVERDRPVDRLLKVARKPKRVQATRLTTTTHDADTCRYIQTKYCCSKVVPKPRLCLRNERWWQGMPLVFTIMIEKLYLKVLDRLPRSIYYILTSLFKNIIQKYSTNVSFRVA